MAKASDLRESGPLAVSAITVFEFLFGIHLKYHGDALKNSLKQAEEFLSAFAILPLDAETSLLAAGIASNLRKSGLEIGIQDVYLAATAIKNSTALVTGNPRHFEMIQGLVVEEW